MKEGNRDDIFIHLTDDFPLGIWEYVRKNPDGYDVYISTKQTGEQMIECYEHAKAHIDRGDLEHDLWVSDAEWSNE